MCLADTNESTIPILSLNYREIQIWFHHKSSVARESRPMDSL